MKSMAGETFDWTTEGYTREPGKEMSSWPR